MENNGKGTPKYILGPCAGKEDCHSLRDSEEM